MLYVKIDENGNPTTPAMSYDELQIAENSVFPNIDIFRIKMDSKEIPYRPVPLSPLPESIPDGIRPAPGVPTKNPDGTFSRTFVFEPISEEAKTALIEKSRLKRDMYLRRYIDTISPVRWEVMSEDEKKIARDFRDGLLTLTDNTSFPFVDFPEVPNFLK